MKSTFIVLYVLVFSSSILANPVASSSTPSTNKITSPKLQFDNKGRLILVDTPEGRSCAYLYDKDGGVIYPIDSSCGDPQFWLKSK